MPVDSVRLKDARIRPARSESDLSRAEDFMRTPRVREIVEGHPEERGAVRLCELDGELIAALLFDPSPLSLRGVGVKCARVLETGAEDGRRHFELTGERALFDYVLKEALGYLWMKRYPVVFVHGSLALYPYHGFVPCFYHPRVYVDVEPARKLPTPYRVRRFKHEDVRGLPALRERNQRWKPMVFAQSVPPFHHFCVEAPDRTLKGYFSLETKPESTWKPKLFVPEVETDDRAATCTILAHCAEQARGMGLEEMHFPLGPGHPVARLCLELGGRVAMRGASANALHDEEMLYLTDPSGFVAGLAPYFAQRLHRAGATDREVRIPLRFGDRFWELRIAGPAVDLVALDEEPEGAVAVRQWQLTQLLMGYRGVSELDVEFESEHKEILRILLPKSWPLSMPDPDLWDDVRRPHPYCEAAEEVIAGVSLPWGEVIG